MNRKFCSFLLMTNITCSCLPFINRIERDFLANLILANLGYHPILSCPISVICSRRTISLMLGLVEFCSLWNMKHLQLVTMKNGFKKYAEQFTARAYAIKSHCPSRNKLARLSPAIITAYSNICA
jgi:hypothetical protein